MKMTFEQLQENIGIHFTNQSLLKQAFYHRSYLNEDKTITASNERLEFLGDAILSFLTSSKLYETYPDYPEGTLTNIRSSIVRTSSLAHAATSLSFGDLLFLSHGEEDSGGRKNPSLLADSFEAFLGALYLDQGIDSSRAFLAAHLFPEIEVIIRSKAYIDYKSLLQEVVQEKSRFSPTYSVTKSEGPDHDRTFYMDACSQSGVLGSGIGKSKQEAEQSAAKNALEKMGRI